MDIRIKQQELPEILISSDVAMDWFKINLDELSLMVIMKTHQQVKLTKLIKMI
ncbi:MAG: hypothetical protein CM15mP106_5900 [Candidatus Neomarinimicrobiota bacterium]|nr:MAG: hypothetical protein CM15mP106_5900 [Candidatus Neomarinimicrobiota bacterium]